MISDPRLTAVIVPSVTAIDDIPENPPPDRQAVGVKTPIVSAALQLTLPGFRNVRVANRDL
jgi:hypothetical protein